MEPEDYRFLLFLFFFLGGAKIWTVIFMMFDGVGCNEVTSQKGLGAYYYMSATASKDPPNKLHSRPFPSQTYTWLWGCWAWWMEVDTGEEVPAQLLIVVVRLVGDKGAQVWELWWSIKANCPGVRM